MSKWISVKDRLPEDEQDVLFCNSNLGGMPCAGWYEKDLGFFVYFTPGHYLVVATHWMPLPKAPPK